VRSPRRFVFGSHLSISGGVANALHEARRLALGTVQVFVKNQRQWRASVLRPDDVAEWFKLRAEMPDFGPLVAHATYLINLAAPDSLNHEKSCIAFAEELERCDILDIPYLVVHPGAAGVQDERTATARVAATLNAIFAVRRNLRCMPLLETTPGQGSSLGHTFEQLQAIIALLEEPQRVGVCIDTCHVFVAGYDIRTAAGYAKLIASAARTIGLDRIRCWHLNDSRGGLGSRLDRHEHIGLGEIGDQGFRNLLADRRFDGVPLILETRKGLDAKGRNLDEMNLARLRQLAQAVN
jgi:deoxyribonuclease-4